MIRECNITLHLSEKHSSPPNFPLLSRDVELRIEGTWPPGDKEWNDRIDQIVIITQRMFQAWRECKVRIVDLRKGGAA